MKVVNKSMLVIMFAASVFVLEAQAQDTAATKKKKSTEVSFDDVLVQGKYHFSDEAVTTVEDDKILDALLGVRTEFKDRIKKSTSRQ
ncbi:MAG: hypothetical protein U1E10_02745, partial [Bdellovibrionales bacterium]|nr:hypothetical protein [Bdellovibrionales bacterium]